MISAMRTTIAVELSGEHSFEAFLDELVHALGRSGLTVEPRAGGRVMQGATQVGTVVRWGTTGVSLEWQSADWAPDDDRTELELRQGRGGSRAERGGCDEPFWGAGESAGSVEG